MKCVKIVHHLHLLHPFTGRTDCLRERAFSDGKEVAGYYPDVQASFYFPTEEAAQSSDYSNAVLFAGSYFFYDGETSTSDIFEDLKTKLTSLYGEPFLETESADDIFESIEYFVNPEEGPEQYEYGLQDYNSTNYVV